MTPGSSEGGRKAPLLMEAGRAGHPSRLELEAIVRLVALAPIDSMIGEKPATPALVARTVKVYLEKGGPDHESTSRTLRASFAGVKGFCRKLTPSATRPCRMMASSV